MCIRDRLENDGIMTSRCGESWILFQNTSDCRMCRERVGWLVSNFKSLPGNEHLPDEELCGADLSQSELALKKRIQENKEALQQMEQEELLAVYFYLISSSPLSSEFDYDSDKSGFDYFAYHSCVVNLSKSVLIQKILAKIQNVLIDL
eukprot:TRINITY_DN18554_c0_g1_i1.p1 TRINITY_DN18554_c0_g1~~TRINITY_DN18554_c0_g1_i1.p1  ORF type:complete len:168 (-),score=27.52 TRINITY_DN18554_c0_g1_i1:27-470(-)